MKMVAVTSIDELSTLEGVVNKTGFGLIVSYKTPCCTSQGRFQNHRSPEQAPLQCEKLNAEIFAPRVHSAVFSPWTRANEMGAG